MTRDEAIIYLEDIKGTLMPAAVFSLYAAFLSFRLMMPVVAFRYFCQQSALFAACGCAVSLGLNKLREINGPDQKP